MKPCGPTDAKTNEKLKNKFDNILEKTLYPEWYDKFVGSSVDEIKKLIDLSEDQRVINLRTKFLTVYFKEHPEYWGSIVKRYDQSMWSATTPVKYRAHDSKDALPMKGKSPARVVAENVNKGSVNMIRSQTGTGKSVLIPLIIFNTKPASTPGKIICTQPRRLNATSISNFVAGMTCTKPGQLVGYNIGGSDPEHTNTNKDTMIIYQTVGKLLQDIKGLLEAKDYPKIKEKYYAIIIDEVHERSIDQDLLLGFLLEIPVKHMPLIVFMSATLDETKFSGYFSRYKIKYSYYQLGDYPESDAVCNITSRNIECEHLPEDSIDYQADIIKTVSKINDADSSLMGILVFLPGQAEISRLNNLIDKSKYWIRILTRDTLKNFRDENKDIDSADKRQLIFATNVAETGITFEKLGYVIDSGLQKLSIYDPTTDADILVSTCVAQDNVIQRRGRIGRIPGTKYKFYTMYTKETWIEMEKNNKFSTPQVYLSDLASTILTLKSAKITSIYDFKWVDRPTNEVVSVGLHKLFHLGAINVSGEITEIGKYMSDPQFSRISVEGRRALYTADKMGLTREVTIIVVMESIMTSIKLGNFCTPTLFPNVKSDHITLLYIYQSFINQFDGKYDDKIKEKVKKWCIINCLSYDGLIEAKGMIDQLTEMDKHPVIVQDQVTERQRRTEQDKVQGMQHIRILQCLFSGYFMKTGTLPEGSNMYHIDSSNVYAKIDKDASFVFTNPAMAHVIYPKHIMYSGLRMSKSVGTGISGFKISLVSEINPNWFGNYAPDYRLVA